MALQSGVKVEVEFVAGTWTDVTADFDNNVGYSVTLGRSSNLTAPDKSSARLNLWNPTGKYTPGVQVLSDGTAAPYYPNVTRRRRVRISNSSGVRYLGFVQSWSPLRDNGVLGKCQLQSVDRMDQLSRVTMSGAISQEVMADSPTLYWPLTDVAGSLFAAEQSGNGGRPLAPSPTYTGAGDIVFGDNGPGFGDGTGVKLPGSAGIFLQQPLSLSGIGTVEAWVNTTQMSATASDVVVLWGAFDLSSVSAIAFDTSGHAVYSDSSGASITSGTSAAVNTWHHFAATYASGTVKLYFDGQLIGSTATAQAWTFTSFFVGDGSVVQNMGQVALYPTALSLARVQAHFNSGRGWSGELVSDRVKRVLGYAGLTSADWDIDVSDIACGTYPQTGKDILSACQDMATTEGGGSVFYVLAGLATFRNRYFRKAGAPVITVDAEKDNSRDGWQPIQDGNALINSATVQRASESGTQATVTASDPAGIAVDGILTGPSVTTYTLSDLDALNLAQWIVASNRATGLRLPQLTVDLLTAEQDLADDVQALEIGSRVRVTNLPAGAAGSTQLDLIVEGWTETSTINTWTITLDVSPADSPAGAIWDDAAYGRWQALPDCALNAALTATATTLVIKTPTGPQFTVDPTAYPLTVQVGAEQITLGSAPSGSTSPQTFTGCTRGVGGTTKSAQASGALVSLYPAATWTL